MAKTLSDIERELAAITAEANAKKKRLRNERVRIQRRENEALGAALRAAGFEGEPDDVAALVALARTAEKHGENVSAKGDEKPAEGAEKAAAKPAPVPGNATPKPAPAKPEVKPAPAPADVAPKSAQTAPAPAKPPAPAPAPAPRPMTQADKAEADTSATVNRMMERYIKH